MEKLGCNMEKLKKTIEGKKQWILLNDYINTIDKYRLSNPSYALDASKSMLESVVTTMLIDNKIEFKNDGNLQDKVKKAFNTLKVMQALEVRDGNSYRGILNSFTNIAKEIGSFRNNYGFISHGRDLQADKFNKYLSDLSIESSELLTCFFIKTYDEVHHEKNRIYYDNYTNFNLYLDESTEEYPNFGGVEMDPSKFLFLDKEAYKERYLEFLEEKDKIFNELFQGWDEFEIFDLISFLPFFDDEELNNIGSYICENFNAEFEELAENILEHLNESQEVIRFCLKEDYGIVD